MRTSETHRLLARDDFSSNRHPALSFCLSMIFSENRYPLFHALTEPVFVLSAVGGIRRAAERATGLMGGDWPGIDRVRGVNLC